MVSIQLFLAAFIQLLVIAYADDFYIQAPNSTVMYLEGTKLNLTCINTNFKRNITWYLNATAIKAGSGFKQRKEEENGVQKIILEKEKLSIDDSGEYKCIDLSDSSKSVEVFVFGVKTYNGTVVSGKPTTIRCEAENLHYLVSFNWTKDHKQLSELSELNGRYIEHENYTLEIPKARRKDAGLYQCMYTVGKKTTITFSIGVAMNMAPYIQSTGTSRNLVQSDKLQLECNVQSYPPSTITWKRDNVTFEKGQRIHWNNKTLTIYDLQFTDKGKYICIASNMIGNASMTVLVRVKDKLAALWPFLGIVAEVVILCIIIFICEKKRSKDMEEDYDGAGQQNMPNAKDHKGKDEIRQRNVRT
ncbi:neuroplastin [Octopus sinensis]|uniref:Neuroplastin n=1 Tax=Octopus sinensis TaxID=2607531 RepID=A0A6P7T5P8_9MOLL|nr:neuroplastin [Octopus sinensis]